MEASCVWVDPSATISSDRGGVVKMLIFGRTWKFVVNAEFRPEYKGVSRSWAKMHILEKRCGYEVGSRLVQAKADRVSALYA